MCAGTAAFAQEQVKALGPGKGGLSPHQCHTATLRAEGTVGGAARCSVKERLFSLNAAQPDELRLPRGVQRREEGVRQGRAQAEEA